MRSLGWLDHKTDEITRLIISQDWWDHLVDYRMVKGIIDQDQVKEEREFAQTPLAVA